MFPSQHEGLVNKRLNMSNSLKVPFVLPGLQSDMPWYPIKDEAERHEVANLVVTVSVRTNQVCPCG